MRDGVVNGGIIAFLIFADANEHFHFFVACHHGAHCSCGLLMVFVGDGTHDAAGAGENINGGIMIAGGKVTRQNNVTVQNGAGFVSDRFGHVIALHKDGIKGGDGALLAHAGALHEAGQFGKDRWRKAAPCGRLARRQADFALGAGKARDRIHQEQNFQPLVSKIIGNGGCHPCGFGALHRGFIRCCHHQYGTLHSFFSEIPFNEFSHLPPALADEGEDGDIGR